MIAFRLGHKNLPLARALGDDDVVASRDHDGQRMIFVYYPEDEEYEILTMDEFNTKFPVRKQTDTSFFIYAEA